VGCHQFDSRKEIEETEVGWRNQICVWEVHQQKNFEGVGHQRRDLRSVS
jgi:hypothetical protein